ncbi:MAG: helix-turn-helix transcriptional regulator [Selenomonadaceae bacterium]|nr:helix-turn-helix transcriptional regulator [Selenomonadaceae bacterium]
MRQDLGLSQRQLGDLIGISPQVFYFYEHGKRDVPVHTIIRLAKAVNMNGNQILEALPLKPELQDKKITPLKAQIKV